MPAGTPDEIKLKKGESTIITLKGLATAGYLWNYVMEGDKDCITVSRDFQLPEELTTPNAGTSADEVFTITAQREGRANVHFAQRREWEKDAEPADEKRIKIIVSK